MGHMPGLRNIGLGLFLGGLLILLIYGAFEILMAGETPLLIRIGLLGTLAGLLILIATLIQEQYSENDSDFKV